MNHDWPTPRPASWTEASTAPDPVADLRTFRSYIGRLFGLPGPSSPEPPPRDPEAARATLQALGWVFPEVDPDGAVLRPERRVRCDVGDAARGPVEQAVVAAVRALGWVFPEVDPDGAVLRPERRVRCDVGDAARGPVEQAVVAAVRAARREGEG